MDKLVFKEYEKRGPVSASSRADGSVELSFGGVSWTTSPRSLALCYEPVSASSQSAASSASSSVSSVSSSALSLFRPRARRVLAAVVEHEDVFYASLGGKRRLAPRGCVLLAWSRALDDCWTLDEDVFRLRYQEVIENETKKQEEAAVAVATAGDAPSASASASASTPSSLVALSASVQGKREENEDAHVSVLDWKEHLALFGVFDGHGGADASAYCAKKMPSMLAADWNDQDPKKSFETAFVALDRKYIGKSNDDGTTAIVAVVDTRQHKVLFLKELNKRKKLMFS